VTRFDLRPLLAPSSIAIVGASESADSWAPEIYRSLQHLGFRGELYPVNPKYDEVWGRRCYASVLDLPNGEVDLAVVVVPARVAVKMVDDCGTVGVKGAMVVSSGFAEAGAEGRELQEQLAATAARHGLPVLGPNVEGFVNYVERVAPYGTTPPLDPVAGPVSVISQSGTVAWTTNQLASDRGFGLRIILGVGNEAVIGLGDMFEWAATDRHTKVVATYIETMRDVDGIARGLRALRAAKKPVLVCAPEGRSEAARRSIVAHTGALAGNTALRDAWLRGLGAILVADPVELFEAAVLLSFHQKVRTTGVAAAFQSGGACTLFAEAAGTARLSLPEFSAETKKKLRKALPSFASQNNPLDVTGQAAVETDMYVGAVDALASDPGVGFVAFDAFPPRLESEGVWAEPVLRRVRELQRSTKVAFASVAMGPLSYGKAAREFVETAGIPFLQGHRASAAAIRALVELQSVRERATADVGRHEHHAKAMKLLDGASGPLDEAQAAALLSMYGVARPKERTVDTSAQAAGAARQIGFPVAVKAVAAELPHKASLGGVRLGLTTPLEVEEAAADVLQAARRVGSRAPRVIVQQMITGAEVLIGAVVDERFGAAVTMRPGGALAEAGEATFVAAPLTPKQATAFVQREAARVGVNSKDHDVRALARAVAAIALAAHDLRDRLASLEANPLIVSSRGAVAVDALAEARPAE
jgi:acetate---CoA ligase (ADP-forming)